MPPAGRRPPPARRAGSPSWARRSRTRSLPRCTARRTTGSGLSDWTYERAEVGEGGLAAFLDGLGPEWRGLSLTMPLKPEALAIADEVERLAERAGAGTRCSSPTTVAASASAPTSRGSSGLALGRLRDPARRARRRGATAASALIAMAGSAPWASRCACAIRPRGIRRRTRPRDGARRGRAAARALAEAEPSDRDQHGAGRHRPRHRAVRRTRRRALLDVAYAPWPTALASAWSERGGRVAPGLDMLVHQALLQVRIFVNGDPFAELPDEGAVLDVMRRSV